MKKPKRYQTTITVKPLETPDFESLLQLLYRGTKNPDLPEHAHRFLKELRSQGDDGRFERAKWQAYCDSHDISKTTYYTMINKLLGAGLIEVIERDFYKLSSRSERFFEALLLSIRAFMAKKRNY